MSTLSHIPGPRPAPGTEPQSTSVTLPNDVLLAILERVDAETLTQASLVNQDWNEAACDPRLPLRRRRLLATCHEAHRRVPALGGPRVRRALVRHFDAVGPQRFARDSASFFAAANWLERRDQPFARQLFAETGKLLWDRVPNFRATLLATVGTAATAAAVGRDRRRALHQSTAEELAAATAHHLLSPAHLQWVTATLGAPRAARLSGEELAALANMRARVGPDEVGHTSSLHGAIETIVRRTQRSCYALAWHNSATKAASVRYRILSASAPWQAIVAALAARVLRRLPAPTEQQACPAEPTLGAPLEARTHTACAQVLASRLTDVDVAFLRTDAGNLEERIAAITQLVLTVA